MTTQDQTKQDLTKQNGLGNGHTASQVPAPLESVTLSGPDLGTVNMSFAGAEKTGTEKAGTEKGVTEETLPAPSAASSAQSADFAGQDAGPESGSLLTPSPVNPYEAALPHPDPLMAEQFMPVLPPDHYGGFLNDLTDELALIADPAARSLLTKRARILALNVEQYRVNHALARGALTRVLAETGVGVRESWTRQDEHLRFMNAASSGVEHEYTRATEAIEQARQQRFDALAEYGAQPDTLSAEGFYQQQALAELAREGHPIRPPEQQTGSKRVFNGFAVFSKFFVGVISGVSINLLFNPESRLYLTIIALTAGVMFSVLLLWLVDELAYRAKMAAHAAANGTPGMGRPSTYISGILAVSVLYLGVEGYLNWDGILRVTQQIAANAAQQGQLTDLSSTADTNAVPQHWSLLAFTMSLVAMAVGAALLQGRERARTVLERERLLGRVAQIKQTRQYAEAARATDHVAYLEAARDRLAPPRDVTSPDHARLNERVLNHWEQERETQVQTLSAGLVRDATQLQEALEDFSLQVQAAQHPQPRRGLLRFL